MFLRWCRDSGRLSVVQCGSVVKEQGVELLTAVGGDGGSEGWVGLRACRHHVVEMRRGGVFGLYGFRGLRLLPLAGLALLLRLLQLVQSGGEGSLQAHTIYGSIVHQDKLLFDLEVGFEDLALASGNVREQPLVGGHLFQMEPLGAGLRLPLG